MRETKLVKLSPYHKLWKKAKFVTYIARTQAYKTKKILKVV